MGRSILLCISVLAFVPCTVAIAIPVWMDFVQVILSTLRTALTKCSE